MHVPAFKTDKAVVRFRRRLVALGVAKGALLWYGIEKLFETRIGFSAQQIVLIGVIAQGCQVLLELPTSIIADRWSRRNILLLAQASMLVCCVILGLSHTLAVYIIGTLFWSLSDALTSGVYEAFAYDAVAAAGYKRYFRKIYTRMYSGELIALAVSGVAAGVLGLHFNLRLSYFLSIASTLVCTAMLLRLPDPDMAGEADGALSLKGHVGGALKTLASPALRWPAAVYVALFGFLTIWYEYYQLLGIDIKLSPLLFGSLISVLTLGMMVGSEIAHHRPGNKKMLLLVWAAVLCTHLVGLRFRSVWWTFASLFVTFAALMLLELYLQLYMQEAIGSKQRATVLSMASTLGYAYFFVLAAAFGVVLKPLGIRGALTVASVPLLLLGAVDVARGIPWAINKTASEVEAEDSEP